VHRELEGTGVSITALLPGHADSFAEQRLSYATAAQVAHLGYQAMMAGEERALAVGSDSTQRPARFLPELAAAAH
jgi:short-subunit dehydrogenase